MTAWQDLPPQTRRQARMNERGASAASGVGRARNRGENPETKDGTDVSLTPETESPVVDTPIVEAATDGEAVTDSGAAADQVAADVAGAYGRRAQRLTDSDEQPAYRARDYSPEGRRRSFTPQKASESGTPAVQSSAPTVGVPIDLAYFTQAAPVVHSLVVPVNAPPAGDAHEAPGAETAAAAAAANAEAEAGPANQPGLAPTASAENAPAAAPVPTSTRVLTRRELRALETAQGLRLPANDSPQEPAPEVAAVESAKPESKERHATKSQSLRSQSAKSQSAKSPSTKSPSTKSQPTAAGSNKTESTSAPSNKPDAANRASFVPLSAANPAPVAHDAVPVRPTIPAAFLREPSAPASKTPAIPGDRGVDLAPAVYTTPIGHWSTGAHADDANELIDTVLSGHVGAANAAITTNALVIPSIPQASDMTQPFSSTGEILVTGSIDLPRSLGSTGAHPARYDRSDIDAIFDAEDNEYGSSDSAPVRAVRAVSTHTSTHGVISAKKPANNRLPMMMAVTAGILAVGVAGLFTAGMIFGYF